MLRVTGRAVGVGSEEKRGRAILWNAGVPNFVLKMTLQGIQNSVDRSMQMYEKWKKTSWRSFQQMKASL